MLDSFELLVILFFIGLVDGLVELVGAKAVGSEICRSNWKVGMARVIVAGNRGRTSPECGSRLARSLMLMVLWIRSHRFVEERGHPLNLAPHSCGNGLGLEL